jgi:hypothetical protein
MAFKTSSLPQQIVTNKDIILNSGSGNTTFFIPSVYKDIQFSISGARVPASNAPTWSSFTANTNLYTFDINNYVDLENQEIPHTYEEGSDLSFHFHFYTNGLDVDDRTIKYGIYYTLTAPNTAAVEGNVSQQITISGNTPDKTHIVTGIGSDISGVGLKIATGIGLRFMRFTQDSGTPPTSDPFISMVGIHCKNDTLGSRQLFIK